MPLPAGIICELFVGAAGVNAGVNFGEVIVDDEFDPRRPRNAFGSLPSPHHRARHDHPGIGFVSLKKSGECLCLCKPFLGKRDIGAPLDAPFGVPGGFTMSAEIEVMHKVNNMINRNKAHYLHLSNTQKHIRLYHHY